VVAKTQITSWKDLGQVIMGASDSCQGGQCYPVGHAEVETIAAGTMVRVSLKFDLLPSVPGDEAKPYKPSNEDMPF